MPGESEAHEPTGFKHFVGFLLLSIITLGVYSLYYCWKRGRINTNLLRSIHAKLTG